MHATMTATIDEANFVCAQCLQECEPACHGEHQHELCDECDHALYHFECTQCGYEHEDSEMHIAHSGVCQECGDDMDAIKCDECGCTMEPDDIHAVHDDCCCSCGNDRVETEEQERLDAVKDELDALVEAIKDGGYVANIQAAIAALRALQG